MIRNTKAEQARRAGKRPQDIKLAKHDPANDSETQISAKIAKWIKTLGAISIRVNAGFITTEQGHRFHGAPPGTSDRINGVPVLLPHYGPVMVFVAIEVKRPGQKPTPKQQKFIDLVNQLGGIGFYAVSVDDAKAKLDAELRRRFGVSNEPEGKSER